MIGLLALWACAERCQSACTALGDEVAACGWADAAWTDRRDFDRWCDAWGLEAPLAVDGDAGEWCDQVADEARAGGCAVLVSGEWSAWP